VRGKGTLVHPTLSPIFGSFPARFRDAEIVHRYDEYNATTLRVTFLEDNIGELDQVVLEENVSTDSVLRQSLQNIVNTQANVSKIISDVSALVLLPGAIQTALRARITSLSGQTTRLLAQLGVSFSSDLALIGLMQLSSGAGAGGAASLSSGTVAGSTNGGKTAAQELPPVFQVGYDPATSAAVEAQVAQFVSANQITPQQAVFQANQARAGISAAIAEAEGYLDNYAYDIVLEYRALAISIQQATEVAISTSQSKVKIFVVDRPMSLRQVAKENGLAPDRQNDIEALNPYLGSVNYVPKGTTLTVPAS
jgi:hypothetical protein